MCPEWSSGYGIQESCTNYVSTKQTLAHPATSARKWRRWTADVAYGVSLRRCNQKPPARPRDPARTELGDEDLARREC